MDFLHYNIFSLLNNFVTSKVTCFEFTEREHCDRV
jgi:hypothetical protein